MTTKRSLTRATEVDAYIFIKASLRELNWDVRNPFRYSAGRVFTQNECLEDPEIKLHLGADRPENIVKVTESVLWIIESKRDQKQLEKAVKEATDYAKKINKSRNIQALFVSGV